jgi:hypothetical protein
MAVLTSYESLPRDRVYEIGNVAFGSIARAGQSFQIQAQADVTAARIHMNRNSGSAEIQVRIETDNGGSPSGTLVHANALATLQQADIPTSDDYVSVSFQPFALEANTTYWLVLKRTVEPGPNFSTYYWNGKQNPPSYDSGVAKYYNGSWNQFTGQDLIFEISGGGGLLKGSMALLGVGD